MAKKTALFSVCVLLLKSCHVKLACWPEVKKPYLPFCIAVPLAHITRRPQYQEGSSSARSLNSELGSLEAQLKNIFPLKHKAMPAAPASPPVQFYTSFRVQAITFSGRNWSFIVASFVWKEKCPTGCCNQQHTRDHSKGLIAARDS